MEKQQEQEVDLMSVFKAIWSKKRKMAKWGLIGLIVGIVVAFSLPKEYQSALKVAPETKAQNSTMGQLGGLAAMVGINTPGSSNSGIDESVYPEIIKSTPFLNEFASIQVPYKEQKITLLEYLTREKKKPWWSYALSAPMDFVGWVFSSQEPAKPQVQDPANPSGIQRLFEYELASRMAVETDKKSGLLTIGVKMQDPKIALMVADSLWGKLSRYMVDYYTAKARQDLRNSQEMLVLAKEAYYKADGQYAEAVDRNQNLISKSAQIKVERFQNERNIAFSVYQQLAQQVEANKISLQQETPIATVIEPARIANRPISPNKNMIIILMTFLGVFGVAVTVAVKQLVKS